MSFSYIPFASLPPPPTLRRVGAADTVEPRKNSWELYGLDFMVDEACNAWLIEINSSPACDYSTGVTERFVKKALVEVLQVVFDRRDWAASPKKSRGPQPETGGWECIYLGPVVEAAMGAQGMELLVKGDSLMKEKNKK